MGMHYTRLIFILILCIPYLVYSKSIDLKIQSPSRYQGGSCVIGATLELPDTLLSQKLVILLSGSGANDRNGSKVNNLYKQVAQNLSSQGIASLRYDKRTSIKGCNKQIKDFTNFSPYIFMDDIENVLKFVKLNVYTRNFTPMLMGHSQAVNFALEVLVRSGVSYSSSVILWAGLAKYDIAQTVIRQLGNRSDAVEYFKRLNNNQVPKSEKFMGAYTRFWKEWIQITKMSSTVASKYLGNALLVQGQNDWNVTREDFNKLCYSLSNASTVECKLFKGLDHCLSKSNCLMVDKAAINYISKWVKENR